MNEVGYIMLAIPFIILFALAWKNEGLGVALGIFGGVFIFGVWIAIAVSFIGQSS